jgi:hypothetical protein
LESRDPHWNIVMRAESELRDLRESTQRLASLEEDSPPWTPELQAYITTTEELFTAIIAVEKDRAAKTHG